MADMSGGTHEQTFPESSESPEARSARAVEALHYEERARLGFRRRLTQGIGDPFADPSVYQVGRELTTGQVVGSYMAGFGLILGGASLVFQPLLMMCIGVALCIAGLAAGGQAARIARMGLVVTGICWFLGMVFALVFERPIVPF